MGILSQALLDRMAATIQRVLSVEWEPVTYRSRTTASGAYTDYPGLSVAFEQYDDRYIAMQGLIGGDRSTIVLRQDQRMRMATADVTWTPTLYDEVIRANGEHWRVMNMHGGLGDPFWQFQGRRAPAG